MCIEVGGHRSFGGGDQHHEDAPAHLHRGGRAEAHGGDHRYAEDSDIDPPDPDSARAPQDDPALPDIGRPHRIRPHELTPSDRAAHIPQLLQEAPS